MGESGGLAEERVMMHKLGHQPWQLKIGSFEFNVEIALIAEVAFPGFAEEEVRTWPYTAPVITLFKSRPPAGRSRAQVVRRGPAAPPRADRQAILYGIIVYICNVHDS